MNHLQTACDKLQSHLQQNLIDLQEGKSALIAEQFLREQCDLGDSEVTRVIEEFLGDGPLGPYMSDPQVTEILVNGAREVWYEREATLHRAKDSFLLEATLERYIRKLLAPLGRKIDRKQPVADARLPDGSRICAAISPAVLGGPHLAIRKFQRQWFDLSQLVESGSLSERAASVLAQVTATKKNILVSGAAGTGKTTLLNALATLVPSHERIITIEDVAELQLNHPHVVRLEARPQNAEGEGAISISSLVKASLRLRPDRLVLGECRGEEVYDVLQAFNTGHGGSMATVHANSARDALARLELLAQISGKNLSPVAIRGFIASSIHFVIHLQKFGAQRQVQSIQEIKGMEEGVFLLRSHEC